MNKQKHTLKTVGVEMGAFWSESVGLTSHRGDAQPTISRRERQGEWVSLWSCLHDVKAGALDMQNRRGSVVLTHFHLELFKMSMLEKLSSFLFVSHIFMHSLAVQNNSISASRSASLPNAEKELIRFTSWFVTMKLQLCSSAVSIILNPTQRNLP